MKLRLKTKVKAIIYVFLILAIIGCIVCTFYYGKSKLKNKSITYTKEGSISYVTYLKDNNHYNNQYLKDDYNYVASLIDYFNVDFNYSYVFGENIKYDMDYEIVANLEVYDSDNTTKPIEKKEFQILEKTNKSGTGQVIKIDLYNQKIDYDTYNKIIQEWKKVVSPEATLKVDFKVNWKGYSEVLHKKVSDSYTKEFSIPISNKVINISKPTKDNDTGRIYADQTLDSWFFIIIGFFRLLLLTCIIGLINVIIKINKNKSKYEQKVNKILREFDRAITEAKGPFIRNNNENYIEVNDFMELLDVHDNLNEPIIYYKSNNNTKSTFIVRNGNDIYLTVIKRNEYD